MARALDEIARLARRWFWAHPQPRRRCRSPATGEIDLCDCDRGARLVPAIRHLGRSHVACQPVDIPGRNAPLMPAPVEPRARRANRPGSAMRVRALRRTVPTDDRDLPCGASPTSGHGSGTMLKLSGRDGGVSPVRQSAAGSLRQRCERAIEHIRISAGVADRNQGSCRVEATPWLRLLLWVFACAALVVSLVIRVDDRDDPDRSFVGREEAPAHSLETGRGVGRKSRVGCGAVCARSEGSPIPMIVEMDVRRLRRGLRQHGCA